MLTFRFAAAFWLVYATLALRPVFTGAEAKAALGSFPELLVAALTVEMLPAVVGIASVLRWLRARPAEARSPYAAATRWAALLSAVGLFLLPFHPSPDGFGPELRYRAGQLLALLLVLDGPIAPAD